MDAFDAADYESLLPRRWKRRLGTAAPLFAVLSPNQFRDVLIAQGARHAQHLTSEFLKRDAPGHPVAKVSTNAGAITEAG